jgi:hypothetical protein
LSEKYDTKLELPPVGDVDTKLELPPVGDFETSRNKPSTAEAEEDQSAEEPKPRFSSSACIAART